MLEVVPGDVVGFPEKSEDKLIDFYCPECESKRFRMIGMEIDGEDSDIVKMQCYECEAAIDGYFVWIEDLEEE